MYRRGGFAVTLWIIHTAKTPASLRPWTTLPLALIDAPRTKLVSWHSALNPLAPRSVADPRAGRTQ
jgi:hypothetical protein